MARIRSVHPDLFLDEAFVSLSPPARIFLIGLWTECDDHGAFEWQPGRLRFKILPADGIPGDDLLGELERGNIIKRVEIDGRSYGLVRNFCRFQRPKKPTFKIEIPREHWNFVAMKSDGSLPSHHHITGLTQDVGDDGNNSPKSVTHHSPTSGGNSALEKEEGEGRRGKEEPSTTIESKERVPDASSTAPPPSASETLSPKEKGASQGKGFKPLGAIIGTTLPADWVPDETQCEKVKADFGMTDADLQSELPAFHALNVSGGVLSKDWSATFYLFCKRFAEHRARQAAPRVQLSRSGTPASKQPEQLSEAEWDGIVAMYARTGRWSRHAGNDPTLSGCLAPKHILEKYEINLETGERRIPPRKVSA